MRIWWPWCPQKMQPIRQKWKNELAELMTGGRGTEVLASVMVSAPMLLHGSCQWCGLVGVCDCQGSRPVLWLWNLSGNASGKHHLSFHTFSHVITDIRQDKTEPTYYMSYHIKHRIFLKRFCMMSKNKTENAVIKSLILLHLSKKLLMCEKVRKLK